VRALSVRALLPVLLALTACSSAADTVATSPGSAAARTSLEVEVVASPGSQPQRWTLTCEPPGGDHPDPARACADLAEATAPFAPLDEGMFCTELYGGPQTAVVRGTHEGEPVQAQLSRTDGCEIARWDGLGAVLAGT